MANYYLGLDVSKGYSDFVTLNQYKQPCDRAFQLDDTTEGHCQLEQYLCTFFQAHQDAQVFAARSEPRAILYMAAWSAVQLNPIIKELYARCMTKGMKPKAALGVCMHKIARIVYGMLKHHRPFDLQIHRNHQTKQHLNHKTQDEKRRFQPFDEHAPISRRQHKKRKKQTQSQDEHVVQCGIREPALPSVT